MRHLSDKARIILLPALIISVLLTAIYTFLHWLLIIKLQVIAIPDEVADFILPLALPWIPILIWLAPRTRIIALKKDSDKPRFGVQMAAWLTMFVPMAIAQSYMDTATGKLTELDDISGIVQQASTKYYSLKTYYINKYEQGAYYSSEVTGRHSEDLNFHINYAVPIYVDSANALHSKAYAWLGISYSKRVDNSGSDKVKEDEWKQFEKESTEDFAKKDLGGFIYLERSGNDDDHRRYEKAAKESPEGAIVAPNFLLPVNEPFEARNGNKLDYMLLAFAGGAVFFFLILLLVKVDEDELQKRIEGHPTKSTGAKDFFMYFVPHRGYIATPIIADINLLIFLIMMFKGLGFQHFPVKDLEAWGGNFGPLTLHGEWWRLFTSTFLHDGIEHVANNMIGLVLVGILTERITGSVKFAFTYLLCGILASLTSVYWHSDVVSVGASGAIFGMYGMAVALLITKKFQKGYSKILFAFAGIFIGANLIIGLAAGIDNAAHIGGLVSGLVIGLILSPTIKKQTEEEVEEFDKEEMTDAAQKELTEASHEKSMSEET